MSYVAFAKEYPFANNMLIATLKTSAADLMVQMTINKRSFSEVDWQRNVDRLVAAGMASALAMAMALAIA